MSEHTAVPVGAAGLALLATLIGLQFSPSAHHPSRSALAVGMMGVIAGFAC